MNKPMLFFAPDDTTGPEILDQVEGTGLEVAVVDPPPSPEVTEIDIPDSGIVSPVDLIGEDPEQAQAQAELAMGEDRPRGPDGKFLPKNKDAKPIEVKERAVEKPVAAKPPEPVVAKVKIGDEEKTTDEWAAEIKALKEKPAKPDEQKPEPPAQPEEDTSAQELATKRVEFIKSVTDKLTPTEADLDVILSGGKAAVEKFREFQQKTVEQIAEAREYIVSQVAAALDKRDKDLAPILERDKQVAQFTDENSALAGNEQLKTNPKGLETYRAVKTEYDQAYERISASLAKGEQVSPQEHGWALQYGASSPEEKRASIASQAAARLPAAPAPEKAAVAAPANGNGHAKPVPRITKPLGQDRPGGGAPPAKAKTQDGMMIDELAEAGKWDRG